MILHIRYFVVLYSDNSNTGKFRMQSDFRGKYAMYIKYNIVVIAVSNLIFGMRSSAKNASKWSVV